MSIKKSLYTAILALLFIIIVMFTATWLITSMQKNDGLVINLAGRQRMLSQKISKDTLCFVLKQQSEPQFADKCKDMVTTTMKVFDITLMALKNSGKAPLTLDPKGEMANIPAASSSISSQLDIVITIWKSFSKDVTAVLEGNDHKALAHIISENTRLLGEMNKAVGMFQKESEFKVRLLLVTQGICVAIGILLAGVLLILIQKQIITPLDTIRLFTHKIVDGDFDAVIRGNFTSNLLALKDSIVIMVDSLKENMSEAEKKGLEAEEKAIQAEDALANAMAKEDEIRELLSKMNEVADKASSISEETLTSASDLQAQVNEAAQGALVQKERTEETATAMEEMTATVLEVAQNASTAAKRAEGAKNKAVLGSDQVKSAVEAFADIERRIDGLGITMGELGKQADSIGQVMNVISDIADQTNLLALNAAIEAARAGDAGRGFAVVADEVRKLAEKTMIATKEVGEVIDTIQSVTKESISATSSAADRISSSMEAANQSAVYMEDIVEVIDETADRVQSIASAAKGQSIASEDINRAVSDVNTIASETAQGMTQSANSIRDLANLAQQLKDVIVQLT